MGSKVKRLYIFTGKGGVGKTTLSLAFTKWLREQGHEANYLTFSQQTLGDAAPTSVFLPAGWEQVPHVHLLLEECAAGYITQKLGSAVLAKWIVGTAFFRALVNMLPGFGYVIFLGKALELLNENPNSTLVLDAPASGHALTMLEATGHFREIFQKGLVFDDTEKMLQRLHDPAHTAIRIFTLPTSLSLSEALELKRDVLRLTPLVPRILLNHSMVPWKQELQTAPEALQLKLRLEQEALLSFQTEITATFPFSAALEAEQMYQDLRQYLEELT